MRQALMLHPDSRRMAATHIEIEAKRPRLGNLVLRYTVTGTISDLRLAPVASPARRDALWRHTCFEAFIRSERDAAYYEFNFAPSTQWAAYRFTGYRNGMSVANEIGAPCIAVRSDGRSYTLLAVLTLESLPDLSDDAAWRLGLSAVIEETGGCISYWALAHPPGRPDFHHSDCFACELAPAWRS